MFETITWRMRGGVATAAVGTVMLAVLAGCTSGGGAVDVVVPATSSSSLDVAAGSGVPVVLHFGDHAVAATLTDTPVSRDFVAMLPMRLTLSDAWGQAKSGRLAQPLRVGGGARILTPAAGGVYYWPDPATFAVYYHDLGQSVPPPGLIRLGTIRTGLAQVAGAGSRCTVEIDRAP